MKKLIIRLIFTVSVPIILGVAASLFLFYYNLISALLSWETDSQKWIKQSQQQILYNQLLSQQIIEEYSFNQLQLQLILMNKLIDKFNNKEILVNADTQFQVCSYRELVFNKCPPDVYKQLNRSNYYADLYFVRSLFRFDLLSSQQQYFIQMNTFLSFYSKTAFYQSQNEGLLKIQMIYNSDTTSILTRIPSAFLNITDSKYQNCKGDSFLEPYDPRCRPWYIYAQENEGYFFYEPYIDAVKKSLIMTLSSQVKSDSQFQSVNSIDFDMSDLVQLFVNSQNQYSVLFHEFNNTIFNHPLLNDDSVLSWQDLEFKNITQNCITDIELENCNQEKQQLSQQLKETIQFIKSGNYSINQQNNLDQLYQYWSKFGVKQISLVFPLVSTIPKYKTQQPYSFSIILTARVIEDQTEKLELFNIININWIKIPLLFEFIIVSLAIVVFILNYGKFQVFQVQKPIEILIQFLQINLILQRQTQIPKCSKKLEKFSCLNQNSKNNLNKKKQSSFQKNKLKNEETLNILFSPSSLDSSKQISRNTFTTNRNQLIFLEKNQDEQKLTQGNTRNNKINSPDADEVDFSQKFDSFREKRRTRLSYQQNILSSTKIFNQKTHMNYGNQETYVYNNLKKNIQTEVNSVSNLKKESQIQITQEQQHVKQQKSKILDELEPLFLEMKIIKETFQSLESLINYEIDAQSQNSEDIMNALFHFAKAKSTFQKLQNLNGLSLSYFNLGLIYMLKNDYQLASEYFLSAIQLNLTSFGIDYSQLQLQNYAFSNDEELEDQLPLLKRRILCFAYSLKQQAFEQIHYQMKVFLNITPNCCQENQINFEQSYKNEQNLKNILQKSIENFRILENLLIFPNQNVSDLFIIFVNIEIAEILIQSDPINQIKQIQSYFNKTMDIINKLQPTYTKIKLQIQNLNEKRLDDYESAIIEEDSSFMFLNNHSNKSQEIRFMIFETFKAKLIFLKGKLEFLQQNYQIALEYFTQSLEEGQFFSPIQRENVVLYLIVLFQNLSIKQDFVDEFIFNCSAHVELILLVQLDFIFQNNILDLFFENVQPTKFLREKDKIQVIIFNKNIKTVIPLTNIESSHHFKLIILSIKNSAKQMIKNQQDNLLKLDWQQALMLSVGNLVRFNLFQINRIKQNLRKYKNINYDNQKQIHLQPAFFNKMNVMENKKQAIILFSNKYKNKNKIQTKQCYPKKIILNNKKIIVYHMFDHFIQERDENQFDSKFFQYEQVPSDKELIQKLNQLRSVDHLSSSNEFMAILKNL
ncbi:tetratricopeptide repeat protein (macronuclear) [Tetrahymena thermophila SB210]|uniref:Tetratricopeptide repeat protein n=1 Tax=Tetrahymena thermophila (strain SB210) TaxID=312017 RepID=I7M7U4_TETTS|nr:tetratricopeptide repeat protein [Tetrahymena thermophila SB210]EAR96015.3 tetratricopeptide repeat protein [Tetrahymena thermophila SB210]|eukprot:XP_001016260.3 tetratricopeptide repeat protein [Tetrahymena thermophila SB210]